MIIKNNKFYFENKQEQEEFLKELQNRWQRLMNTCKGKNKMITNRQILGIIEQKEEYEKRLESLKAAKDICEWFNEANAVNGIQKEYNQVMQEYDQWLDSEIK